MNMEPTLPPSAQEMISGDEHAMALILDLKKQLERMTQRRDTLEEECDLLAEENDRLRTLCQSHNIDPDCAVEQEKVNEQQRGQQLTSSAGDGANIDEEEEFLVNAGGDGMYARSDGREVHNACGAGNALCVEYLHLATSPVADTDADTLGHGEYVLCGGVDKTLRLYALATGVLLFQQEFAAPILAIDSVNALVACSMMDGSHAVVDLRVQHYSDLLNESFAPTVLQNQRDHTKYAVSVKWSPGGDFLVTASHDKTVILYQREESVGEEGVTVKMAMKQKLNLKEIPEDVLFCSLPTDFTSNGGEGDIGLEHSSASSPITASTAASPSNAQQLHLIVPTRGASYLLYVHCVSLQHRKVSLNEHDWDTHCSFNVLHMSLSPNGKQLLVATDKDFHIILKTGTNTRLSLLAGHMCNDYGKPKTAWDETGKYVYSNNQADHNVLVYAVNTGKVMATLAGHNGQVRDIKSNVCTRALLTASYDHKVKEWVR